MCAWRIKEWLIIVNFPLPILERQMYSPWNVVTKIFYVSLCNVLEEFPLIVKTFGKRQVNRNAITMLDSGQHTRIISLSKSALNPFRRERSEPPFCISLATMASVSTRGLKPYVLRLTDGVSAEWKVLLISFPASFHCLSNSHFSLKDNLGS